MKIKRTYRPLKEIRFNDKQTGKTEKEVWISVVKQVFDKNGNISLPIRV